MWRIMELFVYRDFLLEVDFTHPSGKIAGMQDTNAIQSCYGFISISTVISC